ncbi:PLAC8 family [Novymonas esmeraldas]|uniref:PLAC8 family n=1 Tax=Novymonas esmeraldas TaxID=1808958 RepID=A0AAW0ENN0_9TRYP
MSEFPHTSQAQGPLPATVLSFDDRNDFSGTFAEAVVAPAAGVAEPSTTTTSGKGPTGTEDSNVVHTVPHVRLHSHDFSSGLCSCHESWAVCVDAFLCSYCLAGAQHNFLMNDEEGIHVPVCVGMLCVDVALASLSPWLPSSICFHTCAMRNVIRQRYHLHPLEQQQQQPHSTIDADSDDSDSGKIDGWTSVSDCIAVMLCTSCVIAQHQREILHRGDWCGGVFSNRHSLHAPTTVHTL